MTQNAQKDRELADAHHQLREKVIASYMACGFHFIILTAGDRADKKGSRVDKGRGYYQERAAADSGDETES